MALHDDGPIRLDYRYGSSGVGSVKVRREREVKLKAARRRERDVIVPTSRAGPETTEVDQGASWLAQLSLRSERHGAEGTLLVVVNGRIERTRS